MIGKLKGLFSPCLIFCLFLFIASFSEIFAQGKIIGHVTDETTGEPLFGTNIVILTTYMGAATDIEGDYIIVNVPVGVYSIQVSMIGYKKVVKTDVLVSGNQTTRVDFSLEEETTALGEEIVVTAKRDILHKEVSSSQTVISNQEIKDAAGVRTLQDFLSTQAAITNDKYLNIRGGLASETGTMVNGLTFVNQRAGKSESLIPTNAIEQVSVTSSGMNAEYGDFRSGIINVTAKTGSNDGYHGSFSFTRNNAQMKRFGKSITDPSINVLRTHLDPDIAFIGTAEAAERGIVSEYEQQQMFNYPNFRGFNFYAKFLPNTWRSSLKSGEVVTPVNLYLYDAWMHMVNPDWDKLNNAIRQLNSEGLNVGEEVTDEELKNAFSNHELKEGQYADFNFDGGFGGPIPLIGRMLGDATFYLSNVTKRTSYVQPLELDYDTHSNTMLVIKSNITNHITLKLTAAYGYQKGMNSARGADDELPSLGGDIGTGTTAGLDRGAMMPEDNIPLFTNSGGGFNWNYWWYNTMLQPWEQKNLLIGGTITHAISSTTFYDLSISYQKTTDYINPDLSTPRSDNIIAYAGPIPLSEAPYGRTVLPVNGTTQKVADWTFDEFLTVPGLAERFDSKGGALYDNSSTSQLRIKFDFGSQISKMHYIKAGLQYNYVSLDNARWAYWPSQDYFSAYEYNIKVSPRTLGAYVQDEITFEGMVANIGIRMDYYSNGDLKWPTGDPYNYDAFSSTRPAADWLQTLEAGGSVVWDKWNEIDAQLRSEGHPGLLQSTKDWVVFSPRFGISFPISDKAKFYFNFGHFRQMPAYSELYFYNQRWDKLGLYNLGNPNLPPIKTIQYELGADINLFDQYLLHVAGYYKDISGEIRNISYNDNSGSLGYKFRTNDRYRDIEGLEVQITKSVGEILTGWINLKYSHQSSGNTGRLLVSENPATNDSEAAFYNEDPTRPTPVPSINANINLRSPDTWGFLGDWNFSVLPQWRAGEVLTGDDTNPRNVSGVVNEFNWPDYWMVDMKISKTFDFDFIKATFYVDINNLFNRKVFLYNYAFSDGIGGIDYTNYMKSLHLPEYSQSYYDPIRDEENGYYIPGDDKLGDLRSDEKPYINDPDNEIFTFGLVREVWFGIRFDF